MDFLGFVYVVVHIAWVTATVLFLLRRAVPVLNDFLSYGKFQATTRNRQPITTLEKICKPLLPTPMVWKMLYIVGLTSSGVCAILLNTTTHPVAILYTVQVARRLCECFFVHKFSKTRLLSLAHFVSGTSFYVIASITIHLESYRMRLLDDRIRIPRMIIVLATFLFGSIAQHISHRTLANVTPRVGKYGLPRGFLFRYVICPHYFAEIVVYLSFVLALQRTASALMLMFVVTNLTDSALRTKQWYAAILKSEIPSVRTRRAIFPYVL